MKLLFLDIDGVLNSLAWVQAGGGFGCPPKKRERVTKERLKWDPAAVKRLRRIVEATGAHIVISSSWRGYGAAAVRKWRAMFAIYGWRQAPVIGETPDLAMRRESGLFVATKRGEEVAKFMTLWGPGIITHYVCLDDDGDFLDGQPLVQTDMREGLQEEHVDRCVYHLGRLKPSAQTVSGDQT